MMLIIILLRISFSLIFYEDYSEDDLMIGILGKRRAIKEFRPRKPWTNLSTRGQ